MAENLPPQQTVTEQSETEADDAILNQIRDLLKVADNARIPDALYARATRKIADIEKSKVNSPSLTEQFRDVEKGAFPTTAKGLRTLVEEAEHRKALLQEIIEELRRHRSSIVKAQEGLKVLRETFEVEWAGEDAEAAGEGRDSEEA